MGRFHWKVAKFYHHLPCSKKSIFLNKHSGKYFIEVGSAFAHMPPQKKGRETVSDKQNKSGFVDGMGPIIPVA